MANVLCNTDEVINNLNVVVWRPILAVFVLKFSSLHLGGLSKLFVETLVSL